MNASLLRVVLVFVALVLPAQALAAAPELPPAPSAAARAMPLAPAHPATLQPGVVSTSHGKVGLFGRQLEWESVKTRHASGEVTKVRTLTLHGRTDGAGNRSERTVVLRSTAAPRAVSERFTKVSNAAAAVLSKIRLPARLFAGSLKFARANAEQADLARAQAEEAIHLTPSSVLAANEERYGNHPEDYAASTLGTIKRDPDRYTRALANLDKPYFGLPVTTEENGDRFVYVYHGGSIAEKAPFTVEKTASFGVLGKGVYFTPDLALANEYARKTSSEARVVRLKIPVRDLEGRQQLQILAANQSGRHGLLDAPIVLNVTGYDHDHPDTFGVFTDDAYVNKLQRETVSEFHPAGAVPAR